METFQLAVTLSLVHTSKTYFASTKTDFMCFNQDAAISSLNSKPLKLVDHFIYLSSKISSTENDINKGIGKAWTVIDWLTITWESDLSDKIKWEFSQVVAVSILLYGCTTWT